MKMNRKKPEKWNWPLLYYVGTVVLNMTEKEFWDCTPRKLVALLNIHGKVKGNLKENEKITEQSEAIKRFMKW